MGQVLAIGAKRSSDSSSHGTLVQTLGEQTHLGANYIKAMPRYAIAAGLMNSTYLLTAFGRLVHLQDSLLEQLSTQWLMHYHLCAPQGPGPAFWNAVKWKLAVSRPAKSSRPRNSWSSLPISLSAPKGKSLAERSARSTITVFLGTYSETGCLGTLGDPRKGRRWTVSGAGAQGAAGLGLRLCAARLLAGAVSRVCHHQPGYALGVVRAD